MRWKSAEFHTYAAAGAGNPVQRDKAADFAIDADAQGTGPRVNVIGSYSLREGCRTTRFSWSST